jgi:hypothetical protein
MELENDIGVLFISSGERYQKNEWVLFISSGTFYV